MLSGQLAHAANEMKPERQVRNVMRNEPHERQILQQLGCGKEYSYNSVVQARRFFRRAWIVVINVDFREG